jgi:murein DD-endopeptidase MepM/ murein hydrolase activator NlpD
VNGRRLPAYGIVLIVTAVVVLICCGAGGGFFALHVINANRQAALQNQVNPQGCGGQTVAVDNSKLPNIESLGKDQMHNAAIIVSVGQQMKVPPRGWVIAIATAMQESNLKNLGDLGANNDHDSLGLFQQRPSQGWGRPAQVLDPVYASRKFYSKLLAVRNWQNLSLTRAAQLVQRSAFPDAYAKHEPLATSVVNALTNGAARAVGSLPNLRCAQGSEIAASGWTNPLPGSEIASGFRTPSRPTHQGDDLTIFDRNGNDITRGVPIHAAAGGVVSLVKCQAHLANGGFWGCARDGGVNVLGCGWYVEIRHAGNIMTRYCHMLMQPRVHVGQTVAAGEIIGIAGDTGHSSGPHTHFEVHVNGDRSSAGAIDPSPFMREHGAPLGKAS